MSRKSLKKKARRSPAEQHVALRDLVVDMEEPLKGALALTEVLYFIGLGLDAVEDDAADPVLALAGVQKGQIKALIAIWDEMFAASGHG